MPLTTKHILEMRPNQPLPEAHGRSSGVNRSRCDSALRRFVLVLTIALTTPISSLQASYSLFDPSTQEPKSAVLKGLLGPKSGQFSYDKRMVSAAEIATSRAFSSSRYCCWRYVKEALLEARVIDSYPKTRYAKEAAEELQNDFGFKKIPVSDPYRAPTGAVLVYGGSGPGHIEFRSSIGFVSDFISPKPSPLPLIGIYVKPKS